MSAGRKRDLITLERATVAQDAYGEETQSWAVLAQEFAQVIYGRGDERRQAAMEQGQQAATFEVWDNERTRSLTLKDRITFDGGTWDIFENIPDSPGERRITATRAL